MPSSDRHRGLGFAFALLITSAWAPHAAAQQAAGFAVERLYPSAPGAGWFVMDDLAMHGGLGGAVALTAGYSHDPLRVTDGVQRIAIVSDRAFTDFGFAVTYDRWRVYVNTEMPLAVGGQGGSVGGYVFTPPSVDLGSSPDTLSDPRIGLDARLFGSATGPFRIGASAQLIFPNGTRADYDTDDTYRAMGRVLFAGNWRRFMYAAELGIHVRPLDDSPRPGSPQGSELLFGVAAGARFRPCTRATAALIVGPEIYGATAFRSIFASTATALEGLLTGRLEGTAADAPQIRFKLGAGGGINQHFGAPEWRLVFSIELFQHNTR